jgi:hypothetical protein
MKDGGNAVPTMKVFAGPEGFIQTAVPVGGLSLRDYFAAAAIGPLMASDGFEKLILKDATVRAEDMPRFAAEIAYDIADAMLEARKGE